jgi:S1-C subfamily serine protease
MTLLVLFSLALTLTACSTGAQGQTGKDMPDSNTAVIKVPHPASDTSGTTSVASAGSVHTVHTTSLTLAPVDRMVKHAIDKAGPSIVLVKTDQALGSGVVLTRDGYVVTNNHVVQGAHRVSVTFSDGKSIKATVSGKDPLDDLAILKVKETGLPAATLADSSQIQLGETVLAIGNPLGITSTVTEGIISAKSRTVNEGKGGGRIPNAIQTSAAINPGNSGGALINLAGQVIGIPTLTAVDPEFNAPAQGIGFAIPTNKVAYIATQVIQHGKVAHTGQAALGIRATSVTPQLAQQYGLPLKSGVLVASVISGGPAAKAGIKGGDIIVGLNHKKIGSESNLLDLMATHKPGDRVSVSFVTEKGQKRTTKVKLGELPANATG